MNRLLSCARPQLSHTPQGQLWAEMGGGGIMPSAGRL